MPINLESAPKDSIKRLAAAFATDDGEQVEEALAETFGEVRDGLAAELAERFRQADGDRAALSARGFRQLTAAETRYYERFIDAMRSSNPREAFLTMANSDDAALPTTVIEDVLGKVRTDHPLLAAVKTVNTRTLTRWVKAKHTEQLAAWGELDSEVTKEITGAFEVVDLGQGKLSCFAVLSMDMLELGPTFVDAYVREAMAEAMGAALEAAVVNGSGIKGEPVGMMRSVKANVSVNQTTGYPAKTAKKVTDLSPASYGALVAGLVKDESGRRKRSGALSSLAIVCNSEDYLTKVMPATTVLATNGGYVNGLFPVPTKVVQSEAVPAGKAVLGLLDEYSLFVGGNRGLQYSDEYKFLEDQRIFKMVQYANGRAEDDTSFVVLDISGIDPAYITVKAKTDAAAAAPGSGGSGNSGTGTGGQG